MLVHAHAGIEADSRQGPKVVEYGQIDQGIKLINRATYKEIIILFNHYF